YRAMMNPAKADPSLAAITGRLGNAITTPTRVLCGSRDMRREMLGRQQDLFAGPYEWDVVEGAGHFLHRERPAEVCASILEWLGKPET
ncbi:MAG: alpha/beta hydrolase, partial [Pseudoxanthomonas sp.]